MTSESFTASKRKAKYKQYQAKKSRRTEYASSKAQLEPKMTGVLVSCVRGKEKRSIAEIMQLFQEFSDDSKLNPESSSISNSLETTVEGSPHNEPTSQAIEDDIQDELLQLQEQRQGGGIAKRFTSVSNGVDCMHFVQINDPTLDPADWVHRVLTHLVQTGQPRTRFSSRLIPFTESCFAKLPDIEAMAKRLVSHHFKTDLPLSFAIIPKIRNNNQIDRNDIIKKVAEVVHECNNKCTVNLDHPDSVILIEVFRNVCGMSIVKDYYPLKRYNLQMLHQVPEEEPKTSKPKETLE